MLCISLLLTLTLLCINWGSVGECNIRAPQTAIYNSTKQALNRISRKQGGTYANFTPKKNLPKATQTTQLNISK